MHFFLWEVEWQNVFSPAARVYFACLTVDIGMLGLVHSFHAAEWCAPQPIEYPSLQFQGRQTSLPA